MVCATHREGVPPYHALRVYPHENTKRHHQDPSHQLLRRHLPLLVTGSICHPPDPCAGGGQTPQKIINARIYTDRAMVRWHDDDDCGFDAWDGCVDC